MKREKVQGTIKIEFSNEARLVEILRRENSKLQKMLAKGFEVQFTSYRSKEVILNGLPENNARVKAAFSQLVGALTANQHIDGHLVGKIIDGIKNPPKDVTAPASTNQQDDDAQVTLKFSSKNRAIYDAVFVEKVGKSQRTIADHIGSKGKMNVTFELPKNLDGTINVIVHAPDMRRALQVERLFQLLDRPSPDAPASRHLNADGLQYRLASARLGPLMKTVMETDPDAPLYAPRKPAAPAKGALADEFALPAAKPDPSDDDEKDKVVLRGFNLKAAGAPKDEFQEAALLSMRDNALTVIKGRQGTGKTFEAMVMGLYKLAHKQVKRIMLVRPAVSAERDQGALPGGIADKYGPYVAPYFDQLAQLLHSDQEKADFMLEKLIASKRVVIQPLGLMRGRSLTDTFMVLDEAQNATEEQVRLFTSRGGWGTTTVVCGDIEQCDLRDPRTHEKTPELSGFNALLKQLETVDFSRTKGRVGLVELFNNYRGPGSQLATDIWSGNLPQKAEPGVSEKHAQKPQLKAVPSP